jgi:L-seryl-tRNA(Ser) seleniumtransferase
MNKELLRQLPKIDELLKLHSVMELIESFGRAAVTDALRDTIDKYRSSILNEDLKDFSVDEIISVSSYELNKSKAPNLRGVVNASGIIIHTNLGRSVLAQEAVDSINQISQNYSNLEYSLSEGKRGSRYSHIEQLIKNITGAEAALVVNNNAAAVMLVLDTLCKGKEAIVSRGQLVEIGGSFRIPEVMSFSGARLVEVGTTNRTHIYDYENNINENTGVLLKVHTSNFKILGFTEEVSTEELVELGIKSSIPVVEDIGSGVLIDFSRYGLTYEPTVQESVRKGVDVITFSGDKMLGGPQAGIIVGKKIYIEKMKKNQLTRALRIDKLTLAALEGTLKLYLDEKQAVQKIPTLNMILSSKEEHKKRANRLRNRLQKLNLNMFFKVKEDFSMVGGGAMPTEKLQTFVICIKSEFYSAQFLEKKLREFSTPIITRVNNGEVLLDLRTIQDNEMDTIVDAFRSIGESNQ